MTHVRLFFVVAILSFSTKYSFCQQTEVDFNAYTGLFSFHGDGSASTSAISSFSYSLPEKATYNPYGKKNGFSYALECQIQKITKAKNIYGLGLGFEKLISKVSIDTITGDGFIIVPPVAATGETKLTNTFITLNPYIGHRFFQHKISFDLLAGLDLAFCLKSKEVGSAYPINQLTNNIFSTALENNRPMPSIDFRPRVQLKAQIKKIGLIAGYSLGLTNYQTPNKPKAYTGFLRTGLSYQLK